MSSVISGKSHMMPYYYKNYTFPSLSLWLSDMNMVILADELPHDVTGAEELLQRLSEHKTEMDARKNNFAVFLSKGKKLISGNHYAKEEVREHYSIQYST